MKTSELIGAALDWAVVQAAGYTTSTLDLLYDIKSYDRFHPSTDWAHGGPFIEEKEIGCWCDDRTGVWGANKQGIPYQQFGPTPLIAAMRCYVASELGDDINIPEDLCA